MDTLSALAGALRREYPDITITERDDELEGEIPVQVPALPGTLTVTARRKSLETMMNDEAEVLSRWWPGKPAELALADLLCLHLAETIATLRPGELLVRLAEGDERPPPANQEIIPGATAYAPGSGSRYSPTEKDGRHHRRRID